MDGWMEKACMEELMDEQMDGCMHDTRMYKLLNECIQLSIANNECHA